MKRIAPLLALAALAGCTELSTDVPAEPETDTEQSPTADPTMTDASTSTGGETESSSTTLEPETDTEEPSTTTGPECSEDAPCSDAVAPFCVEGACSTCDATEAPDEACAMVDEGLPLCVGISCVQCTAESPEACGGETPLCDAEANTCVGCSFHEECQELGLPACDIATGACFSNDQLILVDVELDIGPNDPVQEAIDSVPAGGVRALRLIGDVDPSVSLRVFDGKRIALISAGEAQLRDSGGGPTIVVSGSDTVAYLHGLVIRGNGDDVGISVELGGALYADNTLISQNSGGVTLAAGTTGWLRNCMVAGDGGNPGVPAISASEAELSVLYSTVGLDFNNGGPALECFGGSVAVRNSILVSESFVSGSAVQCPGANIENSRVVDGIDVDLWFGAMAMGDFSLSVSGEAEFADIAVWEDGDPSFDFEGDARPDTDGAADFAGADSVP